MTSLGLGLSIDLRNRNRNTSGGGGISTLLQLPQSDSTGKIQIGLHEDTREDDINLVTAPDDLLYPIPGTLSTFVPGGVPALQNARVEQNRWPSSDNSDTPTTQIITVANGRTYQLRIGSSSTSGATAVCSGAFVGTLTSDGNAPQSFDIAKTSSSTSLTVTITGGVAGIQLDDVTGKADQNPSEYRRVDAANGYYGFAYYDTEKANTVTGGVVAEAVGAKLSPTPTWVHWSASVNSQIRSRAFDLWGNGGTPTKIQDQVGIDGVPDTAWTLGDDNTGAAESVLSNVTIPDDSNPAVFSAYIGKDADETRFPEFQLILTGGTERRIKTQVNTKTGVIVDRDIVGTAASSIESFSNNFWRLTLKVQNNSSGNTTATKKVFPSVTTSWNTVETAAVGAVVVDWAQFELNKEFSSPPILTTGSATSRDATGIRHILAGYFNNSAGVLRVKITPKFAQSSLTATPEGVVSVRDNADSLLYMDSAGFKSGTASVATAFVADTEIEIDVRWNAVLNELQIGFYDGSWTWGTVVPFSGFTLGTHINNFFGLVSGGCTMSMRRIYDADMTTAQIEALP